MNLLLKENEINDIKNDLNKQNLYSKGIESLIKYVSYLK